MGSRGSSEGWCMVRLLPAGLWLKHAVVASAICQCCLWLMQEPALAAAEGVARDTAATPASTPVCDGLRGGHSTHGAR
eukprot:10665356-Alexandrium_andersonii.AAC.1